jgi:MFS family permease
MNKALRIIILANTIFCFAGALFAPLYAIFVQQITSNIIHIGASLSVFCFTTALLTFILCRVGDRLKEKEFLLIVGFLIRAVAWIYYIFIRSVWQIYLIHLILAFGEAFGSPAFTALFSSHLDKGRHFKDWGYWISISLIISGIASFLGSVLVKNYGFKPLFAFMALLAIVSSLVIYLQPRKII